MDMPCAGEIVAAQSIKHHDSLLLPHPWRFRVKSYRFTCSGLYETLAFLLTLRLALTGD